MQSNDPAALFHASTRSAELNDQLLPKNGFSLANRLADEFHALGVVAAHAGTYLGLVFPSPVDQTLLTSVRLKLVKELSVEPLVFQVGAEREEINPFGPRPLCLKPSAGHASSSPVLPPPSQRFPLKLAT